MSSSQTITLPIPLQSKAWAITNKFDSNTGECTKNVKPIRITEVTLWGNGKVRHYISGNHKYLAKNVFPTQEEAERVLGQSRVIGIPMKQNMIRLVDSVESE